MPSDSMPSCAGVSTTLPSAGDDQTKRPFSNRLANRHSPWPSHHNALAGRHTAREHENLSTERIAMPTPRGTKGRGRKRPTTDYDAGCPVNRHRQSVRRILRPENAWASRTLFRQSSKSLAKTCKSGLHSPVALGSRIQGAASRISANIQSRPLGRFSYHFQIKMT